MPAGTRFLLEERMLGDRLFNAHVDMLDKFDYYRFEVRNNALHAAHPLAWFQKLRIEIDGAEIPEDQFFFVLRGQWIRGDHMKGIRDIFWYIAEPAQIYVRCDGGIGAGEHDVRLTVVASRLEDTAILDDKGLWPLHEQIVARRMALMEEG